MKTSPASPAAGIPRSAPRALPPPLQIGDTSPNSLARGRPAATSPNSPAPATIFRPQPTTPLAPALARQILPPSVQPAPIPAQWPLQSARPPQSPHQNVSCQQFSAAARFFAALRKGSADHNAPVP